ncbi:unnamed protein product [Parnassius mnemosyne]|uniref:Endonuclease/exonuclease/phosphatase domain-containing protein n=1 Tax=Parnassius mnemosyne TaxID=213953 RepID=A0AAV1KDL2_9NEOP
MRPEWNNTDLECIWITIPGSNIGSSYDIHISVVYIPPNSQISSRIKDLINTLLAVRDKYPNDYIIVSGDFNLPCIDWSSGDPVIRRKGSVEVQTAASDLISCCSFIGLSQYNTLLNSSKNTLDLIFSSFPIKVQKSEFVLVIEDVYHPALYISATDILVPSRRPSLRTKYQFKRADYRSMNDLLLKQDWAFITRETSLDRVTDKFYSIINELIEKFVPKIRCSSNYSYLIWYSRALINLIKEKSKLHSSWKKHKNPIDYADFPELRK